MRTLTPTLLAAQRSLGGVPSVRLRVEDRELRFAPLLDDSSSSRQTCACLTAGAILRARIGAGGTVDVQRIANPGDPSAWQAWTTLVTGVATASDVALSALGDNPARVRLYFARTGGVPYRLSWVQSADAGQSWSAPADIVPGLSDAAASLGSANGQLLFHDPADGYLKLVCRAGWDTGSWTAYAWSGAGALPARRGVAAAFANGTYYVVSSDQEGEGVCRLRIGTFTDSTWTAPAAIVPPGLPSASFAPLYPSLIQADGLWQLSYLETSTGPLAYADPTLIHSLDWDHWSYACWVPLDACEPLRRAALASWDGALYLAMERTVWAARAYSSSDPDRCLETGEVAVYVAEEEPWQGRMLVQVHNADGRYDRFGEQGEPGAALRPLARVVLERGFRTPAGEERVERPPCYLFHIGLRRGGRRPGLCLQAEDGWGLLRRWRPDALYLWSGKTISWLIAEIVYRAAGLPCTFDGASAWDMVLDSFAIAPANWDDTLEAQIRAALARQARAAAGSAASAAPLQRTGLGAVQTLLAKASARARWLSDGTLYCFVPWSEAYSEPYTIGGAGEVLDALYGRSLENPNQARVFGEGVAARAGIVGGEAAPRRYLAVYVDPHYETAFECAARASGLVQAGRAAAYLGWVETPCLCGLDLYDRITIQDAQAGALCGALLRAAEIVERYDPREGIFTTRVTFEGL
ncbi:MAG: hypothetical protein K6V36_14975 [Anaerolineae bacterium]|nr:hypothetical protein [Anaerolineae bacterium]